MINYEAKIYKNVLNSWGFLVPPFQKYLLINHTWHPFAQYCSVRKGALYYLSVSISVNRTLNCEGVALFYIKGSETAMGYPFWTYMMSTSHRNPQLLKVHFVHILSMIYAQYTKNIITKQSMHKYSEQSKTSIVRNIPIYFKSNSFSI